MVSKVSLGKNMGALLKYLTQDKNDKTKMRGTFLEYNNCFGNNKELVQQFMEVSKLSHRIERPIWHSCFSFSPNDHVTENMMIEMSHQFSNEFGFGDHQWLLIKHDDTQHDHFHLVINRISPFTGKSASTSHNYKRMVNFCRRMEQQYGLESVQSPEQFLPKEERNQKRSDIRKESLKSCLKEILLDCKSIPEFKERIQSKGYEIEIGRGIAITDAKNVRFKGSQVGYSLDDIKKQLIRNITIVPQIDRPRNLNLNL